MKSELTHLKSHDWHTISKTFFYNHTFHTSSVDTTGLSELEKGAFLKDFALLLIG